jgi:hypothetical protein
MEDEDAGMCAAHFSPIPNPKIEERRETGADKPAHPPLLSEFPGNPREKR